MHDADPLKAGLPEGGLAQDAELFASLYRRFSPGLKVFIGRIIVDQMLAEDVVHEVMLEVWTHPHRFDPRRGSLRSWLLTLAKRRAIDRIRSLEASRARERRASQWDLSDVLSPDDWTDSIFERPRLRAALAGLTQKQRDAVTLRYVHDLSTIEVGTRLGVTTSTAKTRVRDGLLALRAALRAGEGATAA